MAEPLYRVETLSHDVYLTFDDGPYVEEDTAPPKPRVTATTDELLAKLEDLREVVGDGNLSATFFLNGWGIAPARPDDPDTPLMARRREAVRRILEAGHDVANHSFSHHQPWGTRNSQGVGLDDPAEMENEILLMEQALERIPTQASDMGKIVRYFRSPGDPSYAATSPAQPLGNGTGAGSSATRARFRKVVAAANARGHRYISYNILSRDGTLSQRAETVHWSTLNLAHWNRSIRRRSESVNRSLLSFEDLDEHPRFRTRRGAIIVMHSGRAATVKALGSFGPHPGVVPYLYEKGFHVRRVPRGL